ncbi:UNVERIFIED_CONTAM: hypothetical protein GTU68_006089 [Idotea baltica]|nr:hypothetical protein [Idotea baltica]
MGQDRKYSKIPYIVHPINVMQIVRSVSDDEDMLVAAILHDVIEDTPTSIKEISAEFGDSVGSLVDDLTDPSKPEDGNRKDRKIIDREHTAAAQADAKTIKLADLIHNTDSIAGSDEHFARVFMRESEALLEVLKEGNPALLARAQQSLRLLGIQSNRFPW